MLSALHAFLIDSEPFNALMIFSLTQPADEKEEFH